MGMKSYERMSSLSSSFVPSLHNPYRPCVNKAVPTHQSPTVEDKGVSAMANPAMAKTDLGGSSLSTTNWACHLFCHKSKYM